MMKRTVTLLITLAATHAGCGQDTTERTHTPSGGAKGGLASNDTTTPSDSGGEGNLNSWLFSQKQAADIVPLVMTYEASKDDDSPTADPSMKATQDFIKSIADDIMALKAHDPGRNFTVTVSPDKGPNASALNQSLVINKGMITYATNLSLAMVLCHEIAHSTRNHNARAESHLIEYENQRKSQADTLDAKLEAFVNKVWNPTTKEFKFTTQDYQSVKPAWNAFWAEFIIYQKKFESEADIVGGRICANSGFTTTEVEEGFNSLFQKFKSLDRSSTKPGTYKVEKSDLGDFIQSIFAETVHPEDTERQQQITRVKDLFVQGSDKTIATRWKTKFPTNGLSLISEDILLNPHLYKHRTPAEDLMAKRTQRVLNVD